MKDLEHYYSLITEKLHSWVEALVAGLPNAVAALLIVLVFAILASITSSISRRFFSRLTQSKVLVNLADSIIKVIILLIGLVVALDVLSLQKAVLSILAGAGVIGLALGFAFQDLAANFLAGFIMAFRHPFNVDDIIETNDYLGTVVNMNLRNTLLRTFAGQIVTIPNKKVFENPLINYSTYGKRRITINVGVAYDTDLTLAGTTATKAIEQLDFIDKEEGVSVNISEFGDSSINFTIYYWIEYPGPKNYLTAITDGIKAIKAAFDTADIDIPFPIRTLDFSMSNNTPLSTASTSER